MPEAKTTLLLVLAAVAVAFGAFWARRLKWAKADGSVMPTPYELFVGFVTDFFDYWGIGSFATTTSFYRARHTVADERIPGTLNVGHTLPTVAQAFISTSTIEVETSTLIWMIAAAVAGALFGAPIVARLPRRKIQVGLGCALLVLCAVLVIRQLTHPQGGSAIGLSGSGMVIGVAVNFVLGALMTIGVGLYGPCLLLIAMLGMNVKAALPIMMGSCAFLMPLASVPFVRAGSYAPRAALGLTLAGVPGVLVAAFLFNEVDVSKLQWIVAAVIVYTAVNLLRTAASERAAKTAA
jgi:uncharacterized membrane protein YfcA